MSSRAGGTLLESGRMVVKVPVDVETLRYMRGERLNPERLSCIVAGVDDVQPVFHRVKVCMMGAFSGNKCVETGVTGGGNHVPRSSSDNADAGRPLRATRDQGRAPFERMQHAVQLQGNRFPGRQTAGRVTPHPDWMTSVVSEPAFDLKSEPLGEHGIVADLGMDVERNVRGVQRDVVVQQRSE